MSDKFVTCRCQNCDGRIEFDGSGFTTGETRTVECPHCNLETIIFVPPQTSAPNPRISEQHPDPAAVPSAVVAASPDKVELFFYKIDETEKGPFTFDQLRSLWNNGQITGDALYRNEQSPDWKPLAICIGQETQGSFTSIKRLEGLLLKSLCILSLIAFFLPNASISVPIFGKLQISMFDFLTPRSDKSAETNDKPNKPNIREVLNSDDLQVKKANAGAIICGISVLGIMAHYLLTLVWGVLALALKKIYSILTIIWLSLAFQFPILFSIGGHMTITAIKATAIDDASANPDNSPGAALGTALGVAFVNQMSIEPGLVMWALMVFAGITMSLPFLVRQSKAR